MLKKVLVSLSLFVASFLVEVFYVNVTSRIAEVKAVGACNILDTPEGPGCWCADGGWQFHCGGDPNCASRCASFDGGNVVLTCNNNGVCDADENGSSCPSDCEGQAASSPSPIPITTPSPGDPSHCPVEGRCWRSSNVAFGSCATEYMGCAINLPGGCSELAMQLGCYQPQQGNVEACVGEWVRFSCPENFNGEHCAQNRTVVFGPDDFLRPYCGSQQIDCNQPSSIGGVIHRSLVDMSGCNEGAVGSFGSGVDATDSGDSSGAIVIGSGGGGSETGENNGDQGEVKESEEGDNQTTSSNTEEENSSEGINNSGGDTNTNGENVSVGVGNVALSTTNKAQSAGIVLAATDTLSDAGMNVWQMALFSIITLVTSVILYTWTVSRHPTL